MINSVEESISDLNFLVSHQHIQYQPLVDILQKLTSLMRTHDFRAEIKITNWDPIRVLANQCLQLLHKNDFSEMELELLTEFLRFLRNSCARSRYNQHSVLNNDTIFTFAKTVLHTFLQKNDTKETLILKICVQMFGNILVYNETSKPVIWRLFFEEDIFRFIFQYSEVPVQDCAMMVLYNCMSEEISKCVFGTEKGHQILISVTSILLRKQIDWGILVVEFLLKQEEFLNCCYEVLPLQNRLLVLDIMANALKDHHCSTYLLMPTALIVFIEKAFLKHVTQLYTMEDSNVDPSETVQMLTILCLASITDAHTINTLQNSDLLRTSVEALKCIHLLGKEGCNVFSSLSEMKYMSSQFSAEISSHPLYCFKKNLIRLIGNLCFACKKKSRFG